MKPGTLVKLGGYRYKYNAIHVNGGWYDIMPNMIGMFIRYDNTRVCIVKAAGGTATPAIFLFEDKLVSAYLEVFEPLEKE